MSFFKRLVSSFTRPGISSGRRIYTLTVKCNRCGEIISAPVDLRNDLSLDDDEDSQSKNYICRKGLMGRQRCFQQIEVTLHFSPDREVIAREAVGGQFVEAEE